MTDFLSLSGVRVSSLNIAIPLFGLWAGDVTLATDAAVPDDVTLTIGNLSLAGHIYRQSVFGGLRKCRLVAGFGGWRKDVPIKSYAMNGGIQLSLVLGDAAQECGEKVNVPDDQTIGVKYVREGGPASKVLRQLAGPDWYVDPKGVTQIAAWPATQVQSSFTIESQSGGPGLSVIATEDYASWLPGTTFTSPFYPGTHTNKGVFFRVPDDGKLRLEVLT
jgi:hypothetical protein